MQHDRFVDGQPITLADIIEQYLLACNVSLNPSSPIYDSYAASLYAPDVQLILGFRVINTTGHRDLEQQLVVRPDRRCPGHYI
jgi:Predicted solute binding protein